MKKILGIGNALVDVLFEIGNDDLLNNLQLPKGSMQLVDAKRNEEILEHTKSFNKKLVAGGSASNTMRGIALLGGNASYIGIVGDDELGNRFESEMIKSNVKTALFKSSSYTGNASTFISKDGERTFATYLGAAVELSPNHITPNTFSDSDILHIEGYLVQNHALIEKAVFEAKNAGMHVSLDLASYNVVEENKEFLLRIVKEYVDILFANEEEAKAFTGENPENALEQISELCEYAIVKVGKNGSLIKHHNDRVNIDIIHGSVVDTTGAGDLYASGFLYGLANNYSIEKSGNIAKILSGNIIQVVGVQMEDKQWDEIRTNIQHL